MPVEESGTNAVGRRDDAAAARFVKRTLAQWPLIILAALLCAGVGYGVASSTEPVYEATTTIQLDEVDFSALFLADTGEPAARDRQRETATNAQLLALPAIRQRTATRLGGGMTADQLADRVTIVTEPTTDLVAITARDSTPARAASIADLTVESFIVSRRTQTRERLSRAVAEVRDQYDALSNRGKRSATGTRLRSRLRDANVLAALTNGGVTIAQPATVPTASVAPRPKRTAAIGFLAGGLLALGVAMLRARLDQQVREPEELDQLWPLPTVGLVPQSSSLEDLTATLKNSVVLESFTLARTNLRYLHVGFEHKSLAVVGADEGEGKTTAAWHLATVFAMSGLRVVVVEADLRKPSLAKRLKISSSRGLSDVLAGLAVREDATQTITVEGDDSSLTVSVDLIPAGLAPPSPPTLLESSECDRLLEALKRDYDLVLLDTAPANLVADSLIVLDKVDAAIVVTRLGVATRASVGRLADLLEASPTPVIGRLINGSRVPKGLERSTYYSR